MRVVRNPVVFLALINLAYLTALVLVAALYVKPPLLGWIGFGVVGAVGVALAVGAAVLFPRMRASVEPVSVALFERPRLLVLADARCPSDELCAAVGRHLEGRARDVFVVSPVLASPLHYLTDDEQGERAEAGKRLEATLLELRRAGIQAAGEVGSDDPLQALGDELARFPATEVLILTPSDSHWLERRLPERASELVPMVEHVVVPAELAHA